MTQEQILSDTGRALRECFPERAEDILREIEARFVPPPVIEDAEAEVREVRISGTGPFAWHERSGWGLAFEFVRAMRRLADVGCKGDVQVVIRARKG